MPRSAAGRAAPSRAACARVASSARVGPLAGRTRTHAGVAVPRARVEVSRNFSRVRMGEGRLGAANRRLGAHSRRAQYGGSPVENALRRDEVLRRAPVSKSRQSRGRPMRWNSKLAKNSSKKATSASLEHPLPTPSEPPPPSPPSSLPPRAPSSAAAGLCSASASASARGHADIARPCCTSVSAFISRVGATEPRAARQAASCYKLPTGRVPSLYSWAARNVRFAASGP